MSKEKVHLIGLSYLTSVDFHMALVFILNQSPHTEVKEISRGNFKSAFVLLSC